MSPTTVGIVTLPGFNEIDSFVATRMIDSVDGLTVELIGPDATAVSKAGVEVFTPGSFDDTERHAAILVGSGNQTFDHLENEALMASMRFGSDNQLVGSQCSGAAILHRLGLLDGVPVCTRGRGGNCAREGGTRRRGASAHRAGPGCHRRVNARATP